MTAYKVIYIDRIVALPDLESLITHLNEEQITSFGIANHNTDVIAIHPEAFNSFADCFYSNEDEHN